MSAATLRPGLWLTGRAWLDNDRRHVWAGHDCTTERVITMLPFPIWHSTGLHVEPSISCDACSFHAHLDLSLPDDDYRCMETWEVDGRWCELMRGHDDPHCNGMVMWAEYSRAPSQQEQ